MSSVAKLGLWLLAVTAAISITPAALAEATPPLQWAGAAASAEEALESVPAVQPDVVIMDYALPGMDGLTLTRMLKADEKTKNIIIVALTAFAMKGDDLKAIDAGCDGYLSKPIDTRKLPGQVAEILQRVNQDKK